MPDPLALDLTQPDASVADSAAIAFTAAVALEDFRVRILTDDDRFVPNHAEVSTASGSTRVVLTPTPFWPPRGCCRLVVDGQVEKLPTGSGQRFLPFEVTFGVSADPSRLAAAIEAHQRARRHRHRRH